MESGEIEEEKMNDTIKMLLEHRSIRAWTDKKIPEEEVQLLFDVAMQTSTSNGMQQASIIRVNDMKKREALAKIATQAYLSTPSELLVFVCDNYRNYKIVEEKGAESNHSNDIDRFIQGVTDASIMAQNVTVAAESMGLGVVYFGSILNDTAGVCEILNLPENTFPVVGLGIGYPDQEPQLKPRMHKEDRVFIDEYKTYDSYVDELKEYDKEMTTYYDLRNANRRVDSFTDQVVAKNKVKVAKRSEMMDVIRAQGFDIK